MSSSHQSVQRTKPLKGGFKNSQTLVCPECEKPTMEIVDGPYTLPDGTFFEDLERRHCYSCNTILFDIPSARQIVESKKSGSNQQKLLQNRSSVKNSFFQPRIAMTTSDLKKRLDKLAHDLRGPVHTAKLNLEAAEILAQKNGGPQQERLLKHLTLIVSELEKLQDRVEDFAAQLQ